MPSCTICNDTGWRSVGDKASGARVTRCDCKKQEQVKARVRFGHLPPKFENCDLSTFETRSGEHQNTIHVAKRAAIDFVQTYEPSARGLLITGPSGSGKTHLAAAIASELIKKNVQCYFCDYRELLKTIQHSYNGAVPATEMDVLRPVLQATVLIIDELGEASASDWVLDTISYIINHRYLTRATTIFTTSLPVRPAKTSLDVNDLKAVVRQPLPTLGERITDRMLGKITEMCEKLELQTRPQDSAGDLFASSGIPKRYAHCELSNFDLDERQAAYASLASARLMAGRFVEDYPIQREGLLFIGPIGTGKTHLAVSVIKQLIREKSVKCLFADYKTLLHSIRHTYNPEVPLTEDEALRPVLEADVLVIDDLGSVRATSEWVWDTVSMVLNTRYNDNLTTIVTTHLMDAPPQRGDRDPLKGVTREATLGDRITERMRSRLHEMCRKVEMQGEDYRTKYRSASFRSFS
jgi:DNA replication protein DnaC